MLHHPAQQLDIEMPLAKRSLCGFADSRESFDKDIVSGFLRQRSCRGIYRAGAQRLVREWLELALNGIDRVDFPLKTGQHAVVRRTEHTFQHSADHHDL